MKLVKFIPFIVFYLCLSSNAFANGEQQWNGHYYGYVDANNISWDQAYADALTLQYNGVFGNLVTITSQAEADALISFLSDWPTLSYRWIGAYQRPNQNAPDLGWQWVTGEPWAYTNWHFDNNPNNFVGPEPNDAQTDVGIENNEEQYAFYSEVLGDSSKPWYDAPANHPSDGYLIEFSPTDNPTVIPEPSTGLLLGSGLLSLLIIRRRRPK